MNSMSLLVWQQIEKPQSELLYNCSDITGEDGWVPFSIGLGWSIANNRTSSRERQIGDHERLVFCAFNTDTDLRRRGSQPIHRRAIRDTLSRNGIQNTYIPNPSYFNELPHYKFIISPEGNGIDCHRHYEALMAGCIPIIEEHEGIKEKYRGCPVLYTKDYSEITPEFLEKSYSEMKDQVYEFSKLFLSSYSSDDQAQIRVNGNYWSHRLTGANWYYH